MSGFVLAIDQGTTRAGPSSSTAAMKVGGHRPEGIRAALSRPPAGSSTTRRKSGDERRCDLPRRRSRRPGSAPPTSPAIGITNQRETVGRSGTRRPASRSTTPSSGRTAAPRRSAHRLKKAGAGDEVHAKDRAAARPLFLRHQDRLAARQRERRARGAPSAASCLAGTIDTFLVWRLTGGKVHATDATNASRTLRLQHRTRTTGTTSCWRSSASRAAMLPEVKDCAADFGVDRSDRCSAPRSRSSALPATSRRRRSARPASSRA